MAAIEGGAGSFVSGVEEAKLDLEGFFLAQLLIQSEPGILKLFPVWHPVNESEVTAKASTRYVAIRGRVLRMTTRPFGKREVIAETLSPNRVIDRPCSVPVPVTMLSTKKPDVSYFPSVFLDLTNIQPKTWFGKLHAAKTAKSEKFILIL